MPDSQAVDDFTDTLLNDKNKAKAYRNYVDEKYKRWLVSLDALARGREDKNSSEPVRRMENAERNDYGLLANGIRLLRDAVGARES